jgi:hypothetical protein
MPITYNVDPARQIVVALATGPLTLQEVLDYRFRLMRDPAFSPHFSRLIDLRGASQIPNKHEMTIIAERMLREPGSPGAKRAFVADQDAVYGTFRRLEQLASDSDEKWRTFRSVEEAEAWLMDVNADDDA